MSPLPIRHLRGAKAASALLGALSFFGMHTASAEPRALIVGVGEYPNLVKDAKVSPNLPGIDLDVKTMQQITAIMGFQPSQVRVLFNADATLDRVVHELSTWTRDGVGQDDPVVIYFSGHGTRIPDKNGDEPDKADEVLLMSDTGRVRTKETVTLDRVLVDDQLGALLDKIPSRRVLVLIDACHSGTATRAFDIMDQRLGAAEGVPKYYYYDGMPDGTGVVTKAATDGAANFVSLSAAQDTQYAIATYLGGLFTLGLQDAISRAAVAKESPTLVQVRDQVDAYIARSIEPERRHNPMVAGDTALADGGIRLVPLENGNGPLWAELQALAAKGRKLTVTTSRPVYKIGEEVEISVEVPSDGFLNIVTIDSQDSATVLFPNQYAADNSVKLGSVRIPTADMPFVLPAQEPQGPTLVAAFLSTTPLDLRALGIEGRDARGKLTQTFTNLSAAATRAIGVAAREEKFHAGQVTVSVVPAVKP